MIKQIAISLFTLTLLACSDSEQNPSKSTSSNPFPILPTNSSEKVTLSGKMAFWMYEGSAGCYGTISDGSSEVQLWIDADSCGEKEYTENQEASVEVTFKTDNQYGPDKTFTITSFK